MVTLVATSCMGGRVERHLTPPRDHRPRAERCPERAPGISILGDPAPFLECRNDAECTRVRKGRCDYKKIWSGGSSSRCLEPNTIVTRWTYDYCFSDTDCGPTDVCLCDAEDGNRCVPANCRTDADCAGGFCSPTYILSCPNAPGCAASPPAVGGYYCHTADDECPGDSCRESECVSSGGHWKCAAGCP
jgi:hypothetical protein